MNYSEHELLRLAGRWNNPKRNYLLVNPLQAKHIPVSPAAAIEMMDMLGKKLAACCTEPALVIGFAETATAIGAVCAAAMGEQTFYIHTTREYLPPECEPVEFLEEHSHAALQQIAGLPLGEALRDCGAVIFVDDEYSTGKTLRNIVRQLHSSFPAMREKRLIAASVLNRMNDEEMSAFARDGIEAVCLLKLSQEDYSRRAGAFSLRPAEQISCRRDGIDILRRLPRLPDPRRGTLIGAYTAACRSGLRIIIEEILPLCDGHTLVLGTEECMYPALMLGAALEELSPAGTDVFCHATTRSPIGICDMPEYPIRSGFQLPGYYDAARKTFLYNLAAYDTAVVVTDSQDSEGITERLAAVLRQYGRSVICHVEV